MNWRIGTKDDPPPELERPHREGMDDGRENEAAHLLHQMAGGLEAMTNI